MEDPGAAVAKQGLGDGFRARVAERRDCVAVVGTQPRWLRISIFLDGLGLEFYITKISFIK
jgi:hypothetical protein